MVDRKLVEAPSDFIAGRSKVALLFCLLLVALFFFLFFFLARFVAVVSIVSICLVYDFSIVATCPSIPAARFAFCLCFIRFDSVVHSCFVCKAEPRAGVGRTQTSSRVGRKTLVACRPKTALLFLFSGDFRWVVPLLIVIYDIYMNIEIGKK